MPESKKRRRVAGRHRLAVRARRYIREHYAAPGGCTTAKIAQELGVSASFLCHRYRATYGVTIGHDVRQRRMAMARRLLDSEPDRLIKEIAAEVGYMRASYRSFFNAFRAETGMSPSTYQRIAAARTRMPSRGRIIGLRPGSRRTA